MLLVLPRSGPLEIVHCTYAGCFSSLNPAYPALFLVSVVGIVVLFVGVFGARFVLSPPFVAGMVALEYGLAGALSAFWRAGGSTVISPDLFAPLLVIGAFVVTLQGLRRLRVRRQLS
jgi:hypothetical protein